MPPYVKIKPGVMGLKVDLRRTIPAAPQIDVEIGPSLSNLILVVPEGWAAHTGTVAGRPGDLEIQVSWAPTPGCPTLILRGFKYANRVVVRNANSRESGRRGRRR